jgi:hypothetical protein
LCSTARRLSSVLMPFPISMHCTPASTRQ